jgi:hypothetical protein
VTDLSFLCKCVKCSRNFATPARLKNHENLCRDRYSAEDFDPMLSQVASNDPASHAPERELPTSGWIPERASDE